MVRRSSMVYELLKSETRDDGFTPKEIIDRVSQTYDITAGKALRKQVAVALRRGIDFGIIARKNNKYKFDVSSLPAVTQWVPRKAIRAANYTVGKGNNASKKKRAGRKMRQRVSGQTPSKSNKSGVKQQKRARSWNRKPVGPLPPRPKVPKPPNWSPKRRNLSEEPIPKVVKHSSSNEISS
ncbi:uncharacterized protein [Venturia canescens]|uniref:uncharacterized protein n=1 Tax=Venturia canescens TaxID=32260 RepID=UPI001C9C96C5|nr:uncharacterized protein LOC122409082 [Venturia canescens]